MSRNIERRRQPTRERGSCWIQPVLCGSKGKVGSQTTRDDGTFSFSGLQARPEEYWVSVSRVGYFPEELRRLVVLPGLQSMYRPITMESCSPGRCDPGLKTIRVIPGCA